MRWWMTAALLAALGAPAGAQTADQPPVQSTLAQNFKRLSIEQLEHIDVTSASKHAEPVGEAAAAITVITQDDLRRAGVTSLPDALRLAAGIYVGRFDSHTWAVSARGFDISTANKMVVLLDGRDLYNPLFGGVLWDAVDVVIEDIDRIEVIRGPGGSLWGANAVNGVINIITRRADESQGLLVVGGGGGQLEKGVLQYGGQAGTNTAYRVYAKYHDELSEVLPDGSDAGNPTRVGQAGFRFDGNRATRVAWTWQGDLYDGNSDLPGQPAIELGGGNNVGRLTYTWPGGTQLHVQAFYDNTFRRVPQFTERRQTGDVQTDVHVSWGTRQSVVFGGGYDRSSSRTTGSPVLTFDPANRTTSLYSAFGEDTIAIVPNRVDLIAGSKIEHNDYTGVEVQPTLRARWIPPHQGTLWAAVSRAVRMPTRFDEDLRFTGAQPVVLISGNPDFMSETVVASELGYRRPIGAAANVDVSTFVNHYGDLRSEEPTPPAGFPLLLSNEMRARTAGLEAAVDLQAAPWWELHASYAYLHERFSFAPGSLDPTAGALESNDPAHQALLRSNLTFGAIELDQTIRHVSALPHPAIPAYTEMDVHAGWHLGTIELAIIGQNLLHARHQEASTLNPPVEFVRTAFVQIIFRR